MDLGLAGKVAIVTGGSRGLGFAAAKALVAEGAQVVVCAGGEEALKMAAGELRRAASGARVAFVAADVSAEAGNQKVVDTAISEFGRIDVLVNNVGTALGAGLEATSDADWQAAFDQTLFPAVRMSRLSVPHIRKQGSGAIIIVSSIFGREAGGRMTYNAVKAAEISLAKRWATRPG